jgi:O-antigen ligase
MAAIVLYLWPAVLAIMGTLSRPRATAVAVFTVALAGAVVMLAWHETSKVAFFAGLAAFGCAHVALVLTGRLVAIGWVVACLAVLPAALLAHRLDLHNASWLQSSAQHRIIIWNYTAEQVLKAPLLGVGARTTYVLGPRLEATIKSAPGEVHQRTLSVHSHSVYLQTWFELGLMGAALLTLLGLSVLQSIRALPASLQPYAYAAFASAAIMAASSYGLWQIWYLALFGSCAAYFGLASSLPHERDKEA